MCAPGKTAITLMALSRWFKIALLCAEERRNAAVGMLQLRGKRLRCNPVESC